ncbi:guanylate kinase [Porphyromonas sp. COT-239 OH1446]|uniref:guanylate kinase n=1 Tax=Porphyromonas sp. COT-239 OH1446 TaxID=1515613 RepID=UPI00052CBEEA|nr:guanylate kinase [Porphyromonas sp. COT-239 OH1446]KGN70134.1 guanylate kinase [Porphyromonas sp. COT-239 OH1446]
MGKVIIISAPSGTGKSSIIAQLQRQAPELNLQFSISATSRPPRGVERHGVEYYFFSTDEFRQLIQSNQLLEWEEVYEGKYYGTLRSEVDRRLAQGDNVILDVDCVGALNIQRSYPDRSLSLFIQPPSIEELRRRLEKRSTDSPEVIEERLAKAQLELSYAPRFDRTVVNDDLDRCTREVEQIIRDFIAMP